MKNECPICSHHCISKNHLNEFFRLDSLTIARCGNCYWWMKRECPREVNINGMNSGPNMNGYPCKKYTETHRAKEIKAEAKAHRQKAEELKVWEILNK